MSVTVMAEVWQLQIESPQLIVLLAMADHADDDGVCWPSQDLLAWKTQYTVRQVRRIIKGLINDGVVKILRPATPRTTPIYQLTFDGVLRKLPRKQEKKGVTGDF